MSINTVQRTLGQLEAEQCAELEGNAPEYAPTPEPEPVSGGLATWRFPTTQRMWKPQMTALSSKFRLIKARYLPYFAQTV